MNSESNPREIAKILAQEILHEAHPDLSGLLSRVLTNIEDQQLRLGILDAFSQNQESINFDQIWSTWYENRHPELEQFLEQYKQIALTPVSLHVISQLKLGQVHELTKSNGDAIAALLIAAKDQDPKIAENASWVLHKLQDPSAQEEACRWVIEHDDPIARQAAVNANYFPKDPHQRALFFLLTEQWERYENLDFDASLLSAVFQAADPNLRRKVSNFARHSGWSGYVDAITKSRQTRKLSDLSDDEWEAILAILSRDRRGIEMWRLAQVAPVERSAQILRELNDLGWQPEHIQERTEFSNWTQTALQCLRLGKPVSRLPGQKIQWIAHPKPVTCLSIRAQGDLLASGSTDQHVYIWRTEDGSLLHRLQGHSAYIQSITASSDGGYLASGSVDRSVRIWRFENGDLVHALGGHAGEISSLAFSQDARFLASGDVNQVRIWDVQTGKLFKQFPISGGPVSQLAFDANSKFILASGQTGLFIIALFDDLPPVSIVERVRSWQIITCSQPNLTCSQLITSSSYKKIRLWEIPSGSQITVLDGLADGENLCASLNGQFILASERNKLRWWEYPSGALIKDLEGHSGLIKSILCDPQGKFVVSTGEEGSIRLWHIHHGRSHLIEHELNTATNQIVMDPSGKLLAYSDRNQINLYTLIDLESLFQQPLELISHETLSKAKAFIEATPDTRIEQSWLELIHLGINWRDRYEIEISDCPPLIEIGSYDIQLD